MLSSLLHKLLTAFSNSPSCIESRVKESPGGRNRNYICLYISLKSGIIHKKITAVTRLGVEKGWCREWQKTGGGG